MKHLDNVVDIDISGEIELVDQKIDGNEDSSSISTVTRREEVGELSIFPNFFRDI